MCVFTVPAGHELAASFVAFRRSVVVPEGHGEVEALLRQSGYIPVPVDPSELEAGGGGGGSYGLVLVRTGRDGWSGDDSCVTCLAHNLTCDP